MLLFARSSIKLISSDAHSPGAVFYVDDDLQVDSFRQSAPQIGLDSYAVERARNGNCDVEPPIRVLPDQPRDLRDEVTELL